MKNDAMIAAMKQRIQDAVDYLSSTDADELSAENACGYLMYAIAHAHNNNPNDVVDWIRDYFTAVCEFWNESDGNEFPPSTITDWGRASGRLHGFHGGTVPSRCKKCAGMAVVVDGKQRRLFPCPDCREPEWREDTGRVDYDPLTMLYRPPTDCERIGWSTPQEVDVPTCLWCHSATVTKAGNGYAPCSKCRPKEFAVWSEDQSN